MAVKIDSSIYLPLVATTAILIVLQFALWKFGLGKSLVGFFRNIGFFGIFQAIMIVLMALAGLGIALVILLMITTENNDEEMQYYILSLTILAPLAVFIVANGFKILNYPADVIVTATLTALTNVGANVGKVANNAVVAASNAAKVVANTGNANAATGNSTVGGRRRAFNKNYF